MNGYYIGNTFTLVDLDTGTTTEFGRDGDGPEYTAVDLARRGCHVGGGTYRPARYQVLRSDNRECDRFSIDCDGEVLD